MMGTSAAHSSPWFRVLVVLALATGTGWSAVGTFGSVDLALELEHFGLAAGAFVVVGTVVLAFLASLRAQTITDYEGRRRRFDEALLVPSTAAPLAVLSPYFVFIVKGKLVLFVSLPTLLSGLDGGATPQSIGAAAALVATAVVPSILALYVAASQEVAARSVAALSAFQLIAYLGALISFDGHVLLSSFVVLVDGPPGASHETLADVAANALVGVKLGSGALIRFIATISAIAFAVRARHRGRQSIWEMN